MRRISTAALIVCLFISLPSQSRAAEYVLSAIAGNPYQASMAAVLKEAFQRLGHSLDIRYLPAKRALYMANSAATDGEVGRIAKTSLSFVNLVRIPIAIGRFEAVAISNFEDQTFESWEQFRNIPIVVLHGTVWVNNATPEGFQKTYAFSYKEMLKMLRAKRMDYAFGDKAILDYFLRTKQAKFNYLTPSILSLDLYPHIHRTNADLIPQLTKVLEEMKASGEVDKIRDREFDKQLQEMF